jgi:hypothetical protein
MAMLVGGRWKGEERASEVGQRGQSLKLDEVVRMCSEWPCRPSSRQLECQAGLSWAAKAGRGRFPYRMTA